MAQISPTKIIPNSQELDDTAPPSMTVPEHIVAFNSDADGKKDSIGLDDKVTLAEAAIYTDETNSGVIESSYTTTVRQFLDTAGCEALAKLKSITELAPTATVSTELESYVAKLLKDSKCST